MRTFMLLALIGAFSLLANTTYAQFEGGFSRQEYGDLVIVLDEPSFLDLDTALVNATLKQIPLAELIGDEVDADAFSPFQASFQYVDSGTANRLGRPARLSFSFQSNVSHVDMRQIWQRLLEKLNDRLSRTVARLEEYSRRQQDELQARLRAQLEKAEQNLQRATDLHVKFLVENSTSAEAVRQQRQELRARRQELEMQIAAAEARKDAIREQIALSSENALKKAEDDQIGNYLKMAVELAELELEKMQEAARSRAVSELDLRRAEGEVAKAQIELLRHEKGEDNAALAKSIASLNEQLTAVTIDLAESRKLLKFTEKRTNDVVGELANQLLLEGKLQMIEAELAQRREQVQQLQAQLREVESTIQPRSAVRIVPWNE